MDSTKDEKVTKIVERFYNLMRSENTDFTTDEEEHEIVVDIASFIVDISEN